MKITERKKGEWVIDFTLNKKRIRRVIMGTRRMAEQAAIIEKEKIFRHKYGIPEKKKRIRFEDYVKIYIKMYEYPKSLRTIKGHTKTLGAFFRGKFLDEITPGDIEKYKSKRKEEVSKITINRELSVLKAIYNKAINSEDYGLVKNPVNRVKRLDEKSERKRILDADEKERLIEVAKTSESETLHLFLVIALNTGMRKMEILSLKWETVNFPKRIITVTKEVAKSGKSREIPMNDIIFEELSKRDKLHVHVFYNPKTKTNIRNIKAVFRRACRIAEVKNLRLHDLRHTAASHLVNDCGVDIVTASKILGHSDIQMTVRYVHPTTDHKRIAVEKLGQIFKTSRKEVDTMAKTIHLEQPCLPHKNFH